MKQRTSKNAKYQFDKSTCWKIYDRDGGQCIFCRMGYNMESKDNMGYVGLDVMHYVNKSKGGLGIEQNGAIGCRYHHGLLDNGNRGLREEMLGIFKDYLMQQYPDWDEDRLTYSKWDFLTI